jgi:hypothetical protein
MNNESKLFTGLIFFCLFMMGLMALSIHPQIVRHGYTIFTHPENVGFSAPTSTSSSGQHI